ncbi:pyridoxal phosphate-dependent transferase [Syncephalis fuscata]|nr:pyridoxal phosphate-dependent transferase [Syncephalis fuscata]
MLRSYPGNQATMMHNEPVPGIDCPPSTGVIYVMDRASHSGYKYGAPGWANFGQGAPEVGPIPGAAPKPSTITIPEKGFEYAPVEGARELREAVANLYNIRYRQGKASQYTYENVCIVPGGRAGLTRIGATIGDVNVGYFLPEYTAYEQMLSIFKRFVPIPSVLDESSDYHVDPRVMRKEITKRGLGLVLMSNPGNPTGQMVQGEELAECVQIARDRKCTMVFDEFYSGYIYPENGGEYGDTVSSCRYVDNVNEDPIIIVDGLTKNHRLPGWRVCWLIGPKEMVFSMQSAGSFLEGGANHPLQLASIPLLEPDHFHTEMVALQKHFDQKRKYVINRLEAMGLPVTHPPKATFYIWLDLSPLPNPLNVGLSFFEELLKEKYLPGIFFDVNPSHRRDLFESPCHHFVRLSFGPPMEDLERGLDGIERLLKNYNYSA